MDNENTNVEQTTETAEQAKTYTEAEVMEMLQKEGDRRVQSALKKQEKQFNQRMEKERTLSSMDETQRTIAEKDDAINDLRRRLAEYEVEKNRSELKSVLSARGLSAEFADLVKVSDDLEESQENIDKLDRLFKQAVKDEVERRIGGYTPKTSETHELTKEEFNKMPIAKQQAYYEQNREKVSRWFNNKI